jgi:hypothetical protein
MSYTAYSLLSSNAYKGSFVMGHSTGSQVSRQLKEVLHPCELTEWCLLGNIIDDASSNDSRAPKPQTTAKASVMDWPAWRDYIPSLIPIIQLALDAFITSQNVKGRSKSWATHVRARQFEQNENIDCGNH